MSVNKFQPHVLVLPEDDANSQVANGFWLFPTLMSRRMQVLPSAGGWHRVLDLFESDHAEIMRQNANRFMVLLIDFDGAKVRLDEVRARIPAELVDRVFVLGALTEPEDLKKSNLGAYEAIGGALAKDCHDETTEIWNHALLVHNLTEVVRMREKVRPFLFA